MGDRMVIGHIFLRFQWANAQGKPAFPNVNCGNCRFKEDKSTRYRTLITNKDKPYADQDIRHILHPVPFLHDGRSCTGPGPFEGQGTGNVPR